MPKKYTPVEPGKRKGPQGRKPKEMQGEIEAACFRAIEFYRNGYTLEGAANSAGIDHQTVSNYREKNNEIGNAFKEACEFRKKNSLVALANVVQSSMVKMCQPREVKRTVTRVIKQGGKIISEETETEIKTVDPHPRLMEYYSGVVGIIPTATAGNGSGSQVVNITMLPPDSSIQTGERETEGKWLIEHIRHK